MKQLFKSFSFYALLCVTFVGIFPSLMGYSSYYFSQGIFNIPLNHHAVISVATLSIIGFCIGYLLNSSKFRFETWLADSALILEQKLRSKYIIIVLVILFCVNSFSLFQIYANTGFSFDQIAVDRFDVFSYPSLSTGSILLSSLLMPCVLSKNRFIAFLFALTTIAPAASSLSRSGALSCVLIATSYYSRTLLLEGTLFLLLSIPVYSFVIFLRSNAFDSIDFYAPFSSQQFLSFFLDIPNIIGVDLASSISVASSLELRLGLQDALLAPIRLFQIFQPFPLSFIPIKTRLDSLSFHMPNNLGVGINTDILSEPVLMFGILGSLVVWICLGFYFRIIDTLILECSTSHRAPICTSLLFLGRVGFFALGTVANLAAATRPISYVLLMIISARVLRF